MRLWPGNPQKVTRHGKLAVAVPAEEEHKRLRNRETGNAPNFMEHLLAIPKAADDDAFKQPPRTRDFHPRKSVLAGRLNRGISRPGGCETTGNLIGTKMVPLNTRAPSSSFRRSTAAQSCQPVLTPVRDAAQLCRATAPGAT